MVCIFIIALSFGKKSGYINENIYAIIVGIIIFASILRIGYLFFDIFIRDKNNFDEIDNTWILGIYNSQGENANGDDEDDNGDNGDSCPPPATDLEEPDANDPNDPNNM